DKDGNVSAFTLPPDRKQMNVEKARGFQAYKDLSASVKDGVLTVNIDKDGSKIVVQPDGSSDQTIKRGGLDIINHRDRDGNLLPTDKQVEDLSKLIGADLSKPEAQQQLAKELMSRFLFSDEDRAAKDQQTFLKALNEKLAAAGAQVAVQMIENKLNVVVTKAGGQPVKIPIM
ncbi:MAG: hypothetical protein K2Z81_17200, partial [Cyanobacteria bacterium]|nr:hypothetical protein [Cyanobacteriota bacterium]